VVALTKKIPYFTNFSKTPLLALRKWKLNFFLKNNVLGTHYGNAICTQEASVLIRANNKF
jgi:hypothetical protein